MSSHVMFRYRFAPNGDRSQIFRQLPSPQEADIAVIEEQKEDEMWEAPRPIQWLTSAFLLGVSGVVLYSVYLRFTSGLL